MWPLEEYPSSFQPATIADLKDMLLSLKESLHKDMSAMLTNVTTTVQDLFFGKSHAEEKIGDICHAHNDIIDAFNDHEEEIKTMSAKLADLEDCSRRNNIKILPMELSFYFKQFFPFFFLFLSLPSGCSAPNPSFP